MANYVNEEISFPYGKIILTVETNKEDIDRVAIAAATTNVVNSINENYKSLLSNPEDKTELQKAVDMAAPPGTRCINPRCQSLDVVKTGVPGGHMYRCRHCKREWDLPKNKRTS